MPSLYELFSLVQNRPVEAVVIVSKIWLLGLLIIKLTQIVITRMYLKATRDGIVIEKERLGKLFGSKLKIFRSHQLLKEPRSICKTVSRARSGFDAMTAPEQKKTA